MSQAERSGVVVLGASGYTGQQVAAQLQSRRIPFAIAGRNRDRLQALHTRLKLGPEVAIKIADPARPATVPELFSPETGLVVNCAGPFTSLGEPVVRAAVEAKVHYLDITGEQAYLARIVDRYDELARHQNCVVVPACGVEYALTNWAAALAAQGLEPLEEVWTGTVARNVRASRATQLSALEALSHPALGWENGRRRLKQTGASQRRINFPPPFGPRRAVWAPFGEMVTIPRHIQVRNMNSYLAVGDGPALVLKTLAPLVPVVSQIAGKLLRPVLRGPRPDYVEDSRWAVVSQASGEAGTRRVILQGENVYALTAEIAGWCAARMLEPDFRLRCGGGGVLGPAQAFDPQQAVEQITGLRWKVATDDER